MRRVALSVLLAAGLAGCSSFGGGREREELPPPPAASDYQAEVGVEPAWERGLGRLTADAGARLRPVPLDDRVVVADRSGSVYAFAADDGKSLWRRDLHRELTGGPGVGGDLVVVGSRDGRVVALRLADGEIAWTANLTSEVLAPPAVDTDIVVVRVGDGRVFGLDAASGERRWLYEQSMPALTLRGTSAPLLVPGRLAVAGLDTGKLVGLAPDSGRPLWEVTIAAPRGRTDLERMVDIDADPVLFRTDLYAASFNGRLAALDAASGRTRWEREMSVHAGLAVDGARVYVTDAERRLWAVDRFSGASIWRFDDLRGLRLTGPARFGDHLLVGDEEGYLNWLNVRDGTLVRRQRIGGAFVAPPVVQGNAIYLLTADGLTVLRGRG